MKLGNTSVVNIYQGGAESRGARVDGEGQHVISAVTLTELRLGVNKQYEQDSMVIGTQLPRLIGSVRGSSCSTVRRYVRIGRG